MKTKGIGLVTGALGLAMTSGAGATAIIDQPVEGGGEQQVYELSNSHNRGRGASMRLSTHTPQVQARGSPMHSG